MCSVTKATHSEGVSMCLLCDLAIPVTGVPWVLRDENNNIISCVYVREDDGYVYCFMTKRSRRNMGYMRALMDMLTTFYDYLYVDYEVEGPALSVLLGSGFVYSAERKRYQYGEEAKQ